MSVIYALGDLPNHGRNEGSSFTDLPSHGRNKGSSFTDLPCKSWEK
jgi:hypothetical protein